MSESEIREMLISKHVITVKEATIGAEALYELQKGYTVPKTGSDLSSTGGNLGRSESNPRRTATVKTIARDYARRLLQKGQVDFVGKTIKDPVELAVMAQVLRDPRFETFRVFFTAT